MKATSIYAVDDDPMMTELVALHLGSAGYTVTTFGSGWDAVDMLRAAPPALLILDVNMPDGSGFDVLAALRAEGLLTQTRVLMLSGEDDAGVAAAACRDGAAGYVVKPFGAMQLLAEIERLVGVLPDARPAAVAQPAASIARINPVVADLVQAYGEKTVQRLLSRLAGELGRLDGAAGPAQERIEQAAHAIKGAAGTLGFTQVSSTCSALEQACRQGSTLDMPLHAAMQACAHARQEITRHM